MCVCIHCQKLAPLGLRHNQTSSWIAHYLGICLVPAKIYCQVNSFLNISAQTTSFHNSGQPSMSPVSIWDTREIFSLQFLKPNSPVFLPVSWEIPWFVTFFCSITETLQKNQSHLVGIFRSSSIHVFEPWSSLFWLKNKPSFTPFAVGAALCLNARCLNRLGKWNLIIFPALGRFLSTSGDALESDYSVWWNRLTQSPPKEVPLCWSVGSLCSRALAWWLF